MWPLGRISSEIWHGGLGDNTRGNASSLLDLNPICGHTPKCRRRGMGLRTTPSVIAEQGGTERDISVSP